MSQVQSRSVCVLATLVAGGTVYAALNVSKARYMGVRTVRQATLFRSREIAEAEMRAVARDTGRVWRVCEIKENPNA